MIKKSVFFLSALLVAQIAIAHGPEPMPLQRVPVPSVPGLLDGPDPIVVNKEKAVALGKALFWDSNVGSDGMACGSCHFHAGADVRVKNQLNPGTRSVAANGNGQGFDPLPSGAAGGANHTLTLADFPLYQFEMPTKDPLLFTDNHETFSTDDVVSSSGAFSGQFRGVSKFTGANDDCARSVDAVFHASPTAGTRRVEPRNAPTVIDSVFNYRNFWDGRANNVFNGVNPWGDRDPNAGVWVKTGPRSVAKQKLRLINSSLASLSVGPPLDAFEMSCRGRVWPDIGRKLLLRKPLQNQQVHPQDSVLGSYTTGTLGDKGLNTTYRTMVVQAFNPKYWSYSSLGPFGAPSGQTPYNQMEANFSMFFGLALQLYQSTLISDQAPIDLTYRDPSSLRPTWTFPAWTGLVYDQEKQNRLANGLEVFTAAHCNLCHAGPLMTTAALDSNSRIVTPSAQTYGPEPITDSNDPHYAPGYFPIPYGRNAMAGYNGAEAAGIWQTKNVVLRDNTTDSRKLMDTGFFNTGVNDPDADPGIDNVDDFGNPLSFTDQYIQYLLGANTVGINSPIKDLDVMTNIRACDFVVPLASNATNQPNTFRAADGLLVDGSREGSLRTQNCYRSLSEAYIPSPAAAATALANATTARKMAVANKAAFKVPTLRNVELTGPYMHNGSMATLEQVVEFYSRHGNVRFPENRNMHSLVNAVLLDNTDPNYTPEPEEEALFAEQRRDLVEFLKTFTDDRVRYEKAPFDHPEVKVPHGHDLSTTRSATDGLPAFFAKDDILVVPAVGANGRTDKLLPFECYLEPQLASCQNGD